MQPSMMHLIYSICWLKLHNASHMAVKSQVFDILSVHVRDLEREAAENVFLKGI